MIYITGDTHGSYSRIVNFCFEKNLTAKDIIIIMGDTGLNYYNDQRDHKKKTKVSKKVPATLAFVHGNHDIRPSTISTYNETEYFGGLVYQEKEFPNFLFFKDGEIYNVADKTTAVVGGAYSVDKQYRINTGYNWFEDEQPSEIIKQKFENALSQKNWNVDVVLTHTCPLKYEPQEALFESIDQTTVDKTTEIWLDKIENELEYDQWYCGHYHIDKSIDKLRFLFKDIVPF